MVLSGWVLSPPLAVCFSFPIVFVGYLVAVEGWNVRVMYWALSWACIRREKEGWNFTSGGRRRGRNWYLIFFLFSFHVSPLSGG